MPRRAVTSSVEGGEDVVDARLLVVKGSGSTYVAGGKVAGLVLPLLKQMQLANLADELVVDRRLGGTFFAGLPRGETTVRELFLAVARMANVFNNFTEGARLWMPEQVMARVLGARPELTEDVFRAAVMWPEQFDEDGAKIVPLRTVGDYRAALRDCMAIAEVYEPFLEKAFELSLRGVVAG